MRECVIRPRDAPPRDQGQRAIHAVRQAAQIVRQTGRNVDAVGRLGQVQKGAVDIEKQCMRKRMHRKAGEGVVVSNHAWKDGSRQKDVQRFLHCGTDAPPVA